jgi:hypothetical protein
LKSIYAYANIPVDLSRSPNVFSNVNKSSCTLYVPYGSKSAYQVANQWKDFTNIIEKDFTGISPISTNQHLTAFPNPTSGKVKLVLDQLPPNGTFFKVTDFTGRTILHQLIQNTEEWIDLEGNAPGRYFIRTNFPNTKFKT